MFDSTPKILAIPGSVRAGSFNRELLEAAKQIAPSEYEIEIYDGLAHLPIFSRDLEGENIPQQALELDRAVRNADALLISTPEYNGSIPGGLKNLLDWGSRPHGNGSLLGKPTAVIGGSPGQYGAARAVEATAGVLRAAGAVVLERKLTVGRVSDRIDPDGRVTDEMLTRSLQDIISGLGDLARRLVTV